MPRVLATVLVWIKQSLGPRVALFIRTPRSYSVLDNQRAGKMLDSRGVQMAPWNEMPHAGSTKLAASSAGVRQLIFISNQRNSATCQASLSASVMWGFLRPVCMKSHMIWDIPLIDSRVAARSHSFHNIISFLRYTDHGMSDKGSLKPSDPEKVVLEAWSQGFMVGALVIMCGITLANMRKGVLLHKLILVEVRRIMQ